MRILGIESSCDETSAAVVADGREILSDVVHSQIDIHRVYGGVVPEIACRAHIETIYPVVEKALADAKVAPRDLDAIAVTCAPGLVGALLVGVSMAKSLALVTGKPLLGVDHIHAHIYANKLAFPDLEWPCVSLVVSGGHTSLYLVDTPGHYQLLSRTRDDAAGEAYDKVAKLLGLGYPGGPVVDRLARQGNDRAVALPTTRLTHADRNAPELKGDLDFSFSGLKTAVARHVKARSGPPSDSEVADICASFQRIVVTTLLDRLFDAARRYQARSVGIAGGVSANSRLRADFEERGRRREVPTFLPRLSLSTDNAAMIAAAGLRRLRAGLTAPSDLNADAALAL